MTEPTPTYRRSSFSVDNNCVEVARTDDGATLVRNSNHPDAGTVCLPADAWSAFLAAVKAGDLG